MTSRRIKTVRGNATSGVFGNPWTNHLQFLVSVGVLVDLSELRHQSDMVGEQSRSPARVDLRGTTDLQSLTLHLDMVMHARQDELQRTVEEVTTALREGINKELRGRLALLVSPSSTFCSFPLHLLTHHSLLVSFAFRVQNINIELPPGSHLSPRMSNLSLIHGGPGGGFCVTNLESCQCHPCASHVASQCSCVDVFGVFAAEQGLRSLLWLSAMQDRTRSTHWQRPRAT